MIPKLDAMKKSASITLFLLAALGAWAQGAALEAPLGDCLKQLEQQHSVRFYYSPDLIPLQRPARLSSKKLSLPAAMDELCAQLPMTYRIAGQQVLLKPGPEPMREQLSEQLRIPKNELPAAINEAERERLARNLPAMPLRDTKGINKPGGNAYEEIDLAWLRLPGLATETADDEAGDDIRFMQISILPYFGTNAMESDEVVNRFSLNMLWGMNGGVEGVEVGLLFNQVIKDVQGVQVAGLGSHVGGHVSGTQASGLFNINRGRLKGVQAAGLFNISGEAEAVQAAGLFNISRGGFVGTQASGLFNVSTGPSEGAQAAGLFNYSRGAAGSQHAALFNIAGDVEKTQTSGLVNVAKRVQGNQLALINVADTVSGLPIGLFSFIKNGYNRFELSSNDALFANASFKLGARAFYNVLHVGARWDGQTASAIAGGRSMSWALGYGFGTARQLSPQLAMNAEALFLHVNELETWTNQLNLLSQLSLNLSYQNKNRQRAIFAGPVANLMRSTLADAETGERGSSVIKPSYTLAEDVNERRSLAFWLGVQGGIRF